jgi:hypothetical protein
MSSPGGTIELADAAWFLDGIDASSGQASLIRADRATLSAQPFLDEKWSRQGRTWVNAPMDRLTAPAARPQLHFIWHSSFCCSTLLASCLDAPGRCLSLKEPSVLVDFADIKRRAAGRLLSPALARAVFGMLGRRFQPGERVLIKPSNAANALIPEAAAFTEGSMLLLWGDCESFLLSIARAGEAGAAYVRSLFMTLAADGHPASRWSPNDLFQLTDLKLAALVWRMQMDVLEAASRELGDRGRSLDFRRFLDEPAAVLRALDQLFGLGFGRAGVEQVMAGPVFRRDAKTPDEAFDAARRAAEQRRLRAMLGDDLEATLDWVRTLGPPEPRLLRPLDLDAVAPAASAEAAALQSGP